MAFFKKSGSSGSRQGGNKGYGKPFKKGGFEKRGGSGYGKPFEKGRGGGRKTSSFSGGFEQRKELFDVTCAECGDDTQVPFRPTGSRPVLCRRCFRKDDASSREHTGGKARFDRPKFDDARGSDRGPRRSDTSERKFDELNAKLDRIIRDIASLKDAGF